jgi:hypothetical protein
MARCSTAAMITTRPLRSRSAASRTFRQLRVCNSCARAACAHCRCAIIGHGLEAGGAFFCWAHCAQEAGVTGLTDRRG